MFLLLNLVMVLFLCVCVCAGGGGVCGIRVHFFFAVTKGESPVDMGLWPN